MKKFLSLVLSGALCFTAVLATGCYEGDTSSSSSAPQAVETLELENDSKVLTLGDRVELVASYKEIEGKTLTWSSSAPSIVSVDENGYIEALKVGTATITAHYGTKTATCKVEVVLSGNVPTILFNSNMRDEITLMKSSAYDFSASVLFNGKQFADGEFEYYVGDESIATVVDGKLQTKDKAGSTQVSVFATWRGQTVHAKTVTVNVISESTVLLNGGMLTSLSVYTVNSHEGEAYSTSQTISSVFVSEDGVEIEDYELSIIDEGIATLEKSGNEWVVEANKAGKTNLIVSYDGKEFSFDVVVSRPVCNLDKIVDYSESDAKYYDEATQTMKPITELIEGFENLVSYEFAGKEYKIKESALSLYVGESNEVTLYNETVGYRMTINAYTMIVDELKDFEKIYAGATKTDIVGSYVLAKDIIEPATVLTMPTGMVANNFAGEFDGRGHVLSFTFEHTAQARFGLFGGFLKGATIKNLALNNVTKNGSSGKNPAGIICGEGSDGAPSTPQSTLENIYVDVKFSNSDSSNLAFMGNAMWAIAIKNVIIHVPEVPVSETYGSFARGEVSSVSNSYVISSAPLYVTSTPTNPYKVVPVLYADYNAMKAAGNDYSSFSSKFWDTTTHGVPVWKSLVEDFAK